MPLQRFAPQFRGDFENTAGGRLLTPLGGLSAENIVPVAGGAQSSEQRPPRDRERPCWVLLLRIIPRLRSGRLWPGAPGSSGVISNVTLRLVAVL